MDRPGAQSFKVELNQAATIDGLSSRMLVGALCPSEARACAPNMKNVIVLSTPLWGPDSDGEFKVQVHEQFNKKIVGIMDATTEFVKTQSWDEVNAFREDLFKTQSWESVTA